ncbi:MAG: OB-fold domain-containing protein [Chloroflexota bacterium]
MADKPLKEGLFHIPGGPGDKPYLIGGRCKACGFVTFPKKTVCVRCRRDDAMEEIKMGPEASLETYTTMQVGPPEFPPPYVIGYVKMKEGPKVFTLLSDCKPDEDLEPGQEMEMVIDKIREDEAGNNLVGWKFKPVRRRK